MIVIGPCALCSVQKMPVLSEELIKIFCRYITYITTGKIKSQSGSVYVSNTHKQQAVEILYEQTFILF